MASSASALALPADDCPDDHRPDGAAPSLPGPLHEAGELRRAPVPLCDPPFEDETVEAAGDDPHDRVAQETLAIAFALPGGLPVSPAAPADLSQGSHRRLQLVRPLEPKPARRRPRGKSRPPEDEFGPRQTPRASLPEPKPWAGRLVQAIVEVTSGVRPVSQLVRWTTTDVYATVQRRIAHTELSQRTPGGRRAGAIVRSIHVDEPADGVAEVCAVVQHGARCRAIALRLEGFDGRWQCTALQVG